MHKIFLIFLIQSYIFIRPANAFTDAESKVLTITLYITASLTCVSCIIVFIFHFSNKRLQNFMGTIVIHLFLSNFISGINYFLSMFDIKKYYLLCEIQGFFSQFSALAAYLWTASIGYSLYKIVFKDTKNPYYLLKYFIVFNWGLPLITSIFLLCMQYYAVSGSWCWITAEAPYYRFFLLYSWLFVVFFYLVIVLVLLVRKIKKSGIESGRNPHAIYKSASTIVDRTIFYLIVFIMISIIGFIQRIYDLFNTNPNFALTLFQTFGMPLRGLCNSLVYIYVNHQILAQYMCHKKKEAKIEVYTLLDDSSESLTSISSPKSSAASTVAVN